MCPIWETSDSGLRMRVVVDDQAPGARRHWRVWWMNCRNVPGASAATCLVFDAGEVVRRVWAPPANWETLADHRLLALLNAAAGGSSGVPEAV